MNPKWDWRVDPVLLLLLFGIFMFTGVLILVKWMWPADDKLFTVITGLVTGFSGAFLGRMQHSTNNETKPGQTSTVETASVALPPAH